MPLLSRPHLVTLALAGAGTLVFWALNLPLPFLFGPMAASLLAALAGARLAAFGAVSAAARTIIGVAVGASITPAVFAALPQMAASVALVPFYILIIGAVGVPFFRRVHGFDQVTAFYAAMPGGLQDMVLFGQLAGADVRALSLIHATRVLIIVTVVPVVLTQAYGVTLSNPMGASIAEVPWPELLLMALAAVVGWKGGERIGLFGASIIGPLIVAAVLSLSGLIHMRPPREAIFAAQFFIGMAIGVYYVGVTLRELRNVVAAGVAFVLLLAGLAALFTEIVVLLGLAAPLEAFLAFSPGGQAEMTVLAIVVGADLGYVVLHHLTRVILVITGAPLVARLMRLRRR
ncbi:MAG: AbrB family transcriptional regulator [Paracoccaceae bacterium]|nr:AbrB family transcriptional regulator [Paracoccaceae bacterium]